MGFKVEKTADTKPNKPGDTEASFDFDLETPPLAKPREKLERLPLGPTIGQTVEEYVEEHPPEKKTILNPNALITALLEEERKKKK